ncbi:MAG: phosphotransferase, partial [Chloroflexota bacterium]
MNQKIDTYTQHILSYYPNLSIETVTLNVEGQFNDVVMINADTEDGLIFRFAKYAEAAATLQQETIILQHIQDYITLAIPNPIFNSDNSAPIGERFMGYRMISGTTLWNEQFQAITSPAKKDYLAVQIATFLRELHARVAAQRGTARSQHRLG